MPELNPDVPPPFDQGVFLMHYNRGREAFQQGRYGEGRRELEAAQKMRPNDSEVLNLLGLVYFKMGSFSEAEVIYRRLAAENPAVFILHSNLGLILFKQGKNDEAERYLLRAVELRPNYAKSHLYLGLLYKQREKLGLALEHLRFAGAEKVVREIEDELKTRQVEPTVEVPAPTLEAERDSSPFKTEAGDQPVPSNAKTAPVRIPPEVAHTAGATTEPLPKAVSQADSPQTAARKLQDAVDEPIDGEGRIDLARKIEGASKTFALHENGFLEINFMRNVRVKRGTISSYSGNLKFVAESGLLGTTAANLVKADGQGRLFVYEKGRKTFLLDLNDEFIYVEGGHLLALEETLSYRVEPIYDTAYEKKLDTVKIFGKGSLAISTSIEPLTLRVSREYPLSISSTTLVAWTGNLIPGVIDDGDLEEVMIESREEGFKIRFEGEGVVVSDQ